VSTVYSPLLLYTVVVFLQRMLALLFNLCVVHFFVSINDDDDDDDLLVIYESAQQNKDYYETMCHLCQVLCTCVG